jgi:hypothetical protein
MAKIKKAMGGYSTPMKAKSGKSFPDLNNDKKITKADVLIGRGVLKAEKGSKVAKAKKAANGIMSTTTPMQRAERARVARERGEAPMRRKARAAAAMDSAPMMMKKGGKATKKQAATAIAMKKAGKAPKKMMGGGKCKYGC